MVTNVAETMKAFHRFALLVGITLASTGRYRPLRQQYDGFIVRYEPCSYLEYLAAKAFKRHKLWKPLDRAYVAQVLGVTIPDSTYWRKKQNPNGTWPTTVATPGTSNHGWGCADDLAEIVNGRLVSLRASTREWLYRWAPEFGFALETTAELWHWHWICGDDIPPALYWGTEMQRIHLAGDYAILKLVGDQVEWIRDGNVNAALVPLTGPDIALERHAFATLHGTGEFPHPTNLQPTDFASWTQ